MRKKEVKISPELMEIVVGLHVIFQPDYKKIAKWLKSKNRNLGGYRPVDLINRGKSKKVLEFVDAQL